MKKTTVNNSLQICAPEVIGPTFLSYNFQSHCILKRIGSTEKGFVVTGKTFQCSQVFYETDVEVSSKQDADIWNPFCFTRFFFFRNPIETFENQLFLKAS